jgi:uncharacterized YigZ family protein
MPGAAYLEPAGPVEVREKIQRSLFIARLEPCRDEAEARDFLNRVRAEHRDATHNCWAYVIGGGTENITENSSDDGEPSGTAGRPILGAIKRGGTVNTMIIVTRYFGGVKLGVRGLIEAYGGTAARAIEAAETIERVPTRPVTVRLPWGMVGDVTHMLKARAGGEDALSWNYDSPDGDVSVTAGVPVAQLDALIGELESFNASSGHLLKITVL